MRRCIVGIGIAAASLVGQMAGAAGNYELSSASFALDATPVDTHFYRGLSSYKVIDLSGTIFRSATYEIRPVYEDALTATATSTNFALYE